MKSHNAGPPTVYGATGHVDLLYEDWGGDAHILGSNQELNDYLYWHNEDGVFSENARLEIYIWITN
jgi:hypothetical protein